jgi:HD-GYP domain-containing protein (c-di-GMP phosphodiesterase class II)
MTKVMDIAQQPRRLNEHEFEEIKKHPIYGSDMLSMVENIQEGVICVAKQEHERTNGTGYPEGLKDDQIHEYAKIVAIIDVYEALVHPRSYRDAISPHEAIKELLNMNTAMLFKTRILKVLINRIGLYPVGCWVELNTGEIGKVISSNEDSPLRPKVNIIFSREKEKLPQIELLDLSRHTNVYIKRGINPQESDLKFE